ncbi:acyl-CoA dehydrogenase family protein [Pontivivens ytuae]|uniref:Acyl-CoA dehydrogenase family protein n=1 Tax=Pontivivens ytuae TaxID=2789856 RepID=A0A7S9QAX8_9RHOB|nr:acyl-CoA dehydrogenase family protein [Pontivivens ytuae]QPH52268.1 acyl-CoA dehydrogenase family protein [Pontivivens ytuae]
MDFALSDEQQAILEMASDFGRDRLGPMAAEAEHAGIDRAVLAEVGALGMGAIYAGEAHGGSGLSRLDAALIFEGLSLGDPSVAAFISIHNMCCWMADAFASDELRAEVVPGLAAFETVASYCLTEPGSGSDAAALKTSAQRDGDDYVLNGTKAFISGGDFSDWYVVMCRTGEAGPKGISTLLVPKDAPGLSFGGQERKMGWKAQPTAQVQFDDCRVPVRYRVGAEGDGFRFAMKGLDGGRLNIAACSLGGAQGALTKTLTYMGERKAFGETLDRFQALQFRVADAETALQAARIFLRQAAWKLDRGEPDATQACAMAKRFVTDAAFDVANDCLQLHGGYGYLEDYGIEKIVRDLRVHQILEGTNEIMRLIVARKLLADRGNG